MTVTTYAGLTTAVYRRLNRTAETTVFDDCTALAEAEINRRLALAPVRPQHTRATATLDAEYFATPTNILDVDSLTVADGGDTYVVKATTPQNIADMVARDDTTGRPEFYAQVGSDFRLYPAPDTDYTGTLTYWLKVPALTSVATSNWLSLAHPDAYLTGIEAYAKQDYAYPKADIEAAFELFNIALERVLSAYPRRADKAPLRSDLALIATSRSFNIFTGV